MRNDYQVEEHFKTPWLSQLRPVTQPDTRGLPLVLTLLLTCVIHPDV